MLSKSYSMQRMRITSLFLLTAISCQIPSHGAINSEKLVECITEAHHAVANLREGQTCFFVIGNTGSGKSTTIAYLQGARMQLIFDEQTGEDVLVTNDYGVPTISRSEDNFHSQTRYPALFEAIPGRGCQDLLFCDTPGFKDTNVVEERIARSFSLSMVLEKMKVKGILVVIQKDEINGARGDSLKEVFKILHFLLRDPVASAPHLYFCFNKFNPRRSLQNIHTLLQRLAGSLEQAEQRMLTTLLDCHPENIFLVHPEDDGTTRNTINKCLMTKKDGIPPHSFSYTADQLTLQQLGNWVHRITSTCVRIYKNIQKLAGLINKAESAIKTEEQCIDKCNEDWAKALGDTRHLQDSLQQLEEAKNQLEQRKNQLENDRSQIPFKKKVTKHKQITYQVEVMKKQRRRVLGIVVSPKRWTVTENRTQDLPYEVDEEVLYDAHGNQRETPPADRIIYGERRNHSTTHGRVAALSDQLREQDREYYQAKEKLSIITSVNTRLQETIDSAQKQINAHNAALQNYNHEKQVLSRNLESYRPQIEAVAKLRQMVSSENAGIFGPQTEECFKIFNISVSSLAAAGVGLMASGLTHAFLG